MMVEYKEVLDVFEIVEKFLHQLVQPIQIDGHEITITASIDLSQYPSHSDIISELLKAADMTLYRVKENGKIIFNFILLALIKSLKKRINLK